MKVKDINRKSFKIYLIISIILIFVFINPKTRDSVFGLFNSFSGVEKELELVSEFNIDKNINDLDIFNERIIIWEDNKLSFLDFNGFEIFDEEYEFKTPDIFWGEKNLYIVDKSSGKINILNKEGDEVGNINLKAPFTRLEEKGENLFIFRENEDEESIDIIDKDGNILQSHKENIPILITDIEDKKEEYLISTLDIDKGLKSTISVYSITGDELFTLEIKDEVILYSEFIKSNILIATEESLYFIENNKIKWEKNYENIKDIKVVDKEVFILYNNTLERINLKGKISKEKVLKESLDNILVTGDEIFIFGKNNIIIPKRKKNRLSFKTEKEIIDLKYDDEHLLIQKEGKIEIYEIKEKGEK